MSEKKDNVIDEIEEIAKDGKRELLNMIPFLLMALVFYFTAWKLATYGVDHFPQIQSVMWKLGNVTIGAYAGYWIDKLACHTKITPNCDPMLRINRGIIIVGAMLAVALGM